MQQASEAAYERSLVDAYRHGDDTALAILFDRYYTRLCRDAQRFVSSDRAEDIVQDVFTAIIQQRHRWKIHTTVRKYLHAAVRNRARDVTARDKVDATWAEYTTQINAKLDAHRTITPLKEIELQELQTTLDIGLADCTPRERHVLDIASEVPLYAEIGARLGVSRGTVHTLLGRGRRRIRHRLINNGWAELLVCLPLSQRKRRCDKDAVDVCDDRLSHIASDDNDIRNDEITA